MGNRAIIQTRESYENKGIGIYLHWHGGRDSVKAFLKYCELKGYREPDKSVHGWVRLCQVIGNYFGGSLSVGIGNFNKNAGKGLDNGTYIIEGWEIVGRECWHPDRAEQNVYNLTDMLIEIDKAQPENEQLGKDFFLAEEIPVSELKIGDVVYIPQYESGYEKHTVLGFGTNEMRNGHNVSGVPYVDLYDHNGDYTWNINNYILTDTIKVCRQQHKINEWFGQVRWCEEDLANALKKQGYPVTENNIAKLRAICEHHFFTDCMIETGWEYMYNNIGNGDGWDEKEIEDV